MLGFLLGVFRLVWLFGKGHQAVVLENLVLRQQLSVYKREQKRPRLIGRDRWFWIALSVLWKEWRRVSLPKTRSHCKSVSSTRVGMNSSVSESTCRITECERPAVPAPGAEDHRRGVCVYIKEEATAQAAVVRIGGEVLPPAAVQ